MFPCDCIISDLSAVELLESLCEAVGTGAVEVRISVKLDRRAGKNHFSGLQSLLCYIIFDAE